MPTYAHQINVLSIDIDFYFSSSLGRISMEKNLFLFTKSSYLLHVLPNTNLIVDENDTYTKYFFFGLFNSLLQELNIQNASFVNRQIGDFESLKFKMSASIKYALMLNLGGDYVLPLISIEFGQSF